MSQAELRRNFELANAHNAQGNALCAAGRFDQAIAEFQIAIRLNPQAAEFYHNLANVYSQVGRLEDAIALYQSALRIKPDLMPSLSNLGGVLKDLGRIDEALAAFRQAMQIAPASFIPHSNLCYSMHFHPAYDARAIYEEHVRWNQRHAVPLASQIKPFENDRSPDRKLRIGYVSPDFYSHVVARFLLPLLEQHDHNQVDVHCYNCTQQADEMTHRLKSHANVWRDAAQLSDDQLAEQIRQDRIDILVDLTMHMHNHRLLVFARKPAPVQMTYLAYCSTTGLTAIDYRISDPYLDPSGTDMDLYSEETVYLPKSYWCYQASSVLPVNNESPAARNGYVTFGCLNNFAKVSDPTLHTWSQILARNPKSRLLLHCPAGAAKSRVIQRLNIESQRIQLIDLMPLNRYFELYQQIDIALDPFPYCGGTTTCDALWMGVPVITLKGKTAVGRGGVSILSNIGLSQFIASNEAQYIDIATQLCGDTPKLNELRRTLRQKMTASPLMNAADFTHDFENIYRTVWRKWCNQ